MSLIQSALVQIRDVSNPQNQDQILCCNAVQKHLLLIRLLVKNFFP
jgi:hypothetical protein